MPDRLACLFALGGKGSFIAAAMAPARLEPYKV
jgi:hypothetical protein